MLTMFITHPYCNDSQVGAAGAARLNWARLRRGVFTQLRRPAWLAITAMLLCWAQPADGAGPSEPVVSVQEAGWLHQAETTAPTDPQAALQQLQQRLATQPTPALAYALGTLQLQAGDAAAAALALGQALTLLPSFHRARYALAKALLQQHKHLAAAQQITELLDTEVAEPAVLWRLLGHAWLHAERYDAAEVAFANALVRDPDAQGMRQARLHALIKLQRWEHAAALLHTILAADPADAASWQLAMQLSMLQGKQATALVQQECARRLGITIATP